MKVLLAGLMCLVFTITQAFAISGGPWGRGGVTVTGTYAGVLVPLVVVVSPGPPPATLPPDNSLALFTLKIPQTGGGAGAAVIFRNGFFYPGLIDAVGDPDSGKVNALITGSFSKTHTANDLNGVAHDYTFNFTATGQFDSAKVVGSNPGEATSTRLKGKASITYTTENDPNNPDFAAGDSGGPIQYKIRGFKQSESSG
jgi:hypothetical protein